jgi:hypothetical protein
MNKRQEGSPTGQIGQDSSSVDGEGPNEQEAQGSKMRSRPGVLNETRGGILHRSTCTFESVHYRSMFTSEYP